MSSPYCSKCGGLEATRPGDDMGCECRESDGRKCKGCEKPLPDFEYCMECHGVERESEGVVVKVVRRWDNPNTARVGGHLQVQNVPDDFPEGPARLTRIEEGGE